MHIVSRRIGESINIGDNTVLVVIDLKGDKVKLGVMSPIEFKHRLGKSPEKEASGEQTPAEEPPPETGDRQDG